MPRLLRRTLVLIAATAVVVGAFRWLFRVMDENDLGVVAPIRH